jgi:hypothetical protein
MAAMAAAQKKPGGPGGQKGEVRSTRSASKVKIEEKAEIIGADNGDKPEIKKAAKKRQGTGFVAKDALPDLDDDDEEIPDDDGEAWPEDGEAAAPVEQE